MALLAELVAGIEGSGDRLRAEQVAEVRLLARAGALARKQARGASERVRTRDMALRSIAAEIGGVLRVTDRTVQSRIGAALELVEDYPATLEAWEAGVITRGHVVRIVDAGRGLPGEARAEFEAAAIVLCGADTPNRVDSDLRVLADRLHPVSFAERHEAAAATRRVSVWSRPDGMAEVQAVVPEVLARGIFDRITQAGRQIIDARPKTQAGKDADAAVAATRGAGVDAVAVTDAGGHDFTGDTRTIDQVRADVFTDILLTGAPHADPVVDDRGAGGLGAIRANVQVVVPVQSLLGRDDDAVELAGASPIDPATARTLAGCASSLERILTHPIRGTVLEVDRYEPTPAMRRLLRGRDKHCRFPGCRMPAIRCELDHTVDHALGGATACSNLASLCQRHHSMKQFTPWRVRQLPGGVLEWTSPLGRTYREDTPAPLVAFTPAPPPDALPASTAPPPF